MQKRCKNLQNLGLELTPKARQIKGKIDKLDLSKIRLAYYKRPCEED